jgi:predicted transcriptional regulator
VSATTIKVSSELRDRINAVAAERGVTAGSMIETILDDWLWHRQVELAKRQMREAPKEAWDEYLAEAAAWDATVGDGLEDEPWQE